MRLMLKGIGVAFLTAFVGMGMATHALSVDRVVYDKPSVKIGKILRGKVLHVDEKSPQSWNVIVQDQETGEMVIIHINERTNKKDIMMRPDLGDNVVTRYNQENNHAYFFLTDETMNR